MNAFMNQNFAPYKEMPKRDFPRLPGYGHNPHRPALRLDSSGPAWNTG